MGQYQYSVEITLGFGSGRLCPPPVLKNSTEFMAAVHILTYRVTAERMDHLLVERVLVMPKLSLKEARIKEAWEKVQTVGAHVLTD